MTTKPWDYVEIQNEEETSDKLFNLVFLLLYPVGTYFYFKRYDVYESETLFSF